VLCGEHVEQSAPLTVSEHCGAPVGRASVSKRMLRRYPYGCACAVRLWAGLEAGLEMRDPGGVGLDRSALLADQGLHRAEPFEQRGAPRGQVLRGVEGGRVRRGAGRQTVQERRGEHLSVPLL
jgi:hypothetical protein